MDYRSFTHGSIVSCRVKCTYVELYAYNGTDYEFIFSLQKKDFDKEIGIAEIVNSDNLVPITITEESANFINQKVATNGVKNYRIATFLKRSQNVLFCKSVAIDCENIPEEEVEIEEIHSEQKNNSKIWWLIATAVAALFS